MIETPQQESQFINHSELLAWFEQYAGQVLTWEQLQQAPATVTISAKGIYKPKELAYALSISQRLDSPYSDQKPVYQENGSWHYSYAQEETQRGDSASLFTNQGLKKCMDDGVPVAVLVQLTKKPKVTTYRILGLAKVISWKDGFLPLRAPRWRKMASQQALLLMTPPPIRLQEQKIIANAHSGRSRNVRGRERFEVDCLPPTKDAAPLLAPQLSRC